jgi:hypothetical protein
MPERRYYPSGEGVLSDIERDPLGVEWAAMLYESYVSDREGNRSFATSTHKLVEEMEADGWAIIDNALPRASG